MYKATYKLKENLKLHKIDFDSLSTNSKYVALNIFLSFNNFFFSSKLENTLN